MVRFYGQSPLPREFICGSDIDFMRYWAVNREEDKQKVIRKKIINFLLPTNYDVSQFDNLPLSVFPELVERTDLSKDEDEPWAIGRLQRIFWLIRNKAEILGNFEKGLK